MLRISTFNVNGIRAAHRRGFLEWYAARSPDVIALQEVRCPLGALPEGAFAGMHAAYDPGTLAGRNGVAVLTRVPPAAVRAWGPTTHLLAPDGMIDDASTGLEPLARRHGVLEAQVALAWVLGRPGVTAVIAGASTAAQVRANVRAVELRLLPGERAGLEAEMAQVQLDPHVRPRRRDRLRDRGERIAEELATRLRRRFPWL